MKIQLPDILKRNEGYVLQNRQTILDDDKKIIITPEIKNMMMPFTDPLWLNFKVFIDTTKEKGFFGRDYNEGKDGQGSNNKQDSALAYLKRIGEEERYQMLKIWQRNFIELVKMYDFLLIEIDGLENIYSAKQDEAWLSENKIKFKIRETADMRVQSLIHTYRQIVYDSSRGVQIIPNNLLSFPLSVMVYASGYFNSELYDLDSTYQEDTYKRMFPTYKKLDNIPEVSSFNTIHPFNYILFDFPGVTIDMTESGTSFFTDVSNNVGNSMVTNNLTFTFWSCAVNGVFNNTIGQFDFGKILAFLSAQDKLVNTSGFLKRNIYDGTFFGNFMSQIYENANKWGPRGLLKNFQNAGEFALNKLMKNSNRYLQALNLWATNLAESVVNLTSPDYYFKLANSSVARMIDLIDDKVYEGLKIRDINRFMETNFSDKVASQYKRFETKVLTNIEHNDKIKAGITAAAKTDNHGVTLFSDTGVPNDGLTVDMKTQGHTNEARLLPSHSNIYHRKSF